MEREKDFLSRYLAGLIPEGTTINFELQPFDRKLLELAWQSPNDRKTNLIEVLMQPKEKDRIEIKDNH